MSLRIKLRNLRYSRDWSQVEIADHLKVSQPAYHLWETDQTKPTTENLLRISEVYNVDLYSLLDFKDQSISPQYYFIDPKLLENLIKNQNKISQLQEQIIKIMENQNKTIENLLKK
ncbi:helix-turn-helix domain-containing protein [Chryseobacterium populi]|uniref:Putative transcriptional regulator n=1 Tax=Chryseobacterium populi TaxID=1144316 RepID=J2K6V4_9FLAO|nr:helix-turn-helix transcriptional regulator [Chryseobacterium populi]EJL68948.1 putative transcriptional regulator [Chryseobacterium populi]